VIVLDSGAAIEALVARPANAPLLERLAGDADLHAPHLIDVEVLHVLRRLVSGGVLSSDRAEDALDDWFALQVTRYPHVQLADRMWALRHDLTAYDAAFVALAEILEAPLVTTDRRISNARDVRATVEVFMGSDS
jgi:predicted nucleic acid-binding protein